MIDFKDYFMLPVDFPLTDWYLTGVFNYQVLKGSHFQVWNVRKEKGHKGEEQL